MQTNFEAVQELQAWLATLEPEMFLKFWYGVALYQGSCQRAGDPIELCDAIVDAYREIRRMIDEGVIGEDMRPVLDPRKVN